MNVDPVLIDDDDVDMEPVVVLDEDEEKINSGTAVGAPSVPTVETIVLDDESPIITEENNAEKNIQKPSLKKSEKLFVNNLKNNRLMDKIVTKCINMENSTGMPRVIYKTVLPLYRDTNNTFKKSGSFRALLKKTYKLLMRDPDHKFLHIKTLCEELKSGGLRRKVPFVTLATNLKNNGSQWDHKELTSSSRETNENNAENTQIPNINTNNNKTRKRVGGTGTKTKYKKSRKCSVNTKDRIKTRSVANAEKEKTDIIDLDDSDTDSEDRSENVDDQNDVIIIEETEPSDLKNDNLNTVLQETLEAESNKGNQVVQETSEADSNKENKVLQETSEAESNKGNQVVQETSEADSNKENKVLQETLEAESNKGNQVVQETSEADSNKENNVVQDTIKEDSDTENSDDKSKSSDNEMDYDLLIPQTHVILEVLPIEYEGSHNSTNDLEIITRLENQIINYKKVIDKLEETVVTTESPYSSPYYLCSKYKENVVACYKQICEIKGNCKDIVKRREIRLIVAEGHPPGPAKRLEEYLNSTIDKSGAVEFPDFSDVVKCVVEANLSDNLAWNRQQVIQEAVALFRQCGQALRKRRQKREYRDLLSLIGNKEEIDDPAEKDPILLAKLEENKLIAKIKEEEILKRYVSMENNATPRVVLPQVGNTVEFESDQDSSDSDSESEQNITLPSNITTSTINNQPDTEESSRSNINLSLLRTNNIIVTSTFRNNHCDTGQSSNDVIVIVDPMLMQLLTLNAIQSHAAGTATNENQYAIQSHAAGTATNENQYAIQSHAAGTATNENQYAIQRHAAGTATNENQYAIQRHAAGTATNENQYATRESFIINDAISNNDSDMLPTNTKNVSSSKLELTITETVVGFNNATINENSDMSLINSMRNVENTEPPVNTEPRNVNDVQNNVSGTTDSIKQLCNSSKTEDNVKREPLDIQNMLDELGDGFVCQVFDIEDPFLVIEISSDGFTDDDE